MNKIRRRLATLVERLNAESEWNRRRLLSITITVFWYVGLVLLEHLPYSTSARQVSAYFRTFLWLVSLVLLLKVFGQ